MKTKERVLKELSNARTNINNCTAECIRIFDSEFEHTDNHIQNAEALVRGEK